MTFARLPTYTLYGLDGPDRLVVVGADSNNDIVVARFWL